MDKPKVLFVCPSFQSFVENDIQILASRYEVVVNNYNWSRKALAPWYFFLQFWAVGKALLSVELIVVSFGGYWAFWPSILGRLIAKPTYIILHGTDCASIPELHYGSLRIALLKWICGESYQYASSLLPVSESLVMHQNDYYRSTPPFKQGFKYFFPEVKTQYSCIPNGFDTEFWQKDANIKKEPNSFLAVLSTSQFILKGGDIILQIASRFPECSFYFAGLQQPGHLKAIPDNVHFLGKLNALELRNLYSKSQFYFQMSIFEGFGCALCEAMLCECIPIVSKVNFLPYIIGDYGYILDKRDDKLLVDTIHQALKADNNINKGIAAREHIRELFPLENRREKILAVLGNKLAMD
ncbi:MAG TPA: glycosyltransferase family 4 protein [Anditalea sp.]|nr:glycosyltransferase family 4 protein [Anditalea sp.]